jgi:asparagine synthase (glutamine-hydrolysing)
LARDRAGEKPLFYRVADGAIYFASELKALLANPNLPRRIDPEALDTYLMLGYVPGDRCILAGYQKLPAAHAMTFDLRTGSSRVWRYWSLPAFDPLETIDESALVSELDSLLQDAVGRQLQADVPVGVLLSGGVDSSLVTAMAVRMSAEVHTYSIGFPGHDRFDETNHARLVADHFGTQHTELMAEPAWADLIPLLARQFDEPVADSSMIPTFLLSRLVRQQCTVALGGDGGDELFGGYAYYSQILRMAQRASRVSRAAATLMRSIPRGRQGCRYPTSSSIPRRVAA